MSHRQRETVYPGRPHSVHLADIPMPRLDEITDGDFVVATVRRPGTSLCDTVGLSDLTTDDVYLERGISLRHGFLTELYVDAADYIVPVPAQLRRVGVLLEPMFGQRLPPYRNAGLVEELGARYASTRTMPLAEAFRASGPFDVIFEATGFAPLVFEAMEALGKNGVLVLASVTGGDRQTEVPADRINLGFVLGNKVAVGTVNSNRSYFEAAVRDLAVAEVRYEGWVAKLLTHPVHGLERFQELFDVLASGKDVIKAYIEVGREDEEAARPEPPAVAG